MQVKLTLPHNTVEALFPPSVRFTPIRYSAKDKGGYHEAEIRVDGSDLDLKSMASKLAYGVTIYGKNSIPRWHGYVSRVEITLKNIRLSYDLDDVSNAVKLAYTLSGLESELIGQRATTTWKRDTDSIDRYGLIETLETGGNMSGTAADNMATKILRQRRLPHPAGEASRESDSYATLFCKGSWQCLSWRLSDVPTTIALSYMTIGNAGLQIAATGRVAMAEPFQPAQDINLVGARVYVKRTGTPGNLIAQITEWDTDELPGTVVTSGSVDFTAVGTEYTWINIPVTGTLTKGKKYYVVIQVSGGDTSNYYSLLCDGAMGYGYGTFKTKTGTTWSTENYDMPFMLIDNKLIETTQQIMNHLSNYGQLLKTVRVANQSGVSSESYRGGDTLAIDEVEELLEIGTSAYKPMYAIVKWDDTVDIFEQPSADSVQYELREDGKLYYIAGAPIEPESCPVAMWVSLDKVLDGVRMVSGEDVRNVIWIESGQYDCLSGEYSWTSEGWTNPYVRELKATISG